MEQNTDRQVVYYFRNGFFDQATQMFTQLIHDGLDPKWGPTEYDEDNHRATTITLPDHQVAGLRMMQNRNPARYGNNPAHWCSRPGGRPDRVPATNGLYWFRSHKEDDRRLCEVTDDRVRFPRNRHGIAHQFLGHAVVFEPLTLEDWPTPREQAFVISVDNSPGVGILRNPGDPAPRPNSVLDAYSEQYAIDRKLLKWSIMRFIPMPTIKDFND